MTGAAKPSSSVAASRWTRLHRARMAPLGAARSGPARFLGLGAVLLLLASAGVLAWSALRPLPALDETPSEKVPVVPALLPRSADVATRSGLIARLSENNIFAHQRKPWAATITAAPGTTGAQGAPGTAEGQPAGATAVAPEQSVPSDIKPAYDNLLLRAVYELKGKPAMLVAFAQGDEPGKTYTHQEGDEFIDKVNASPAWKVVAIEPRNRRAVLSRGGRQVELRLYRNAPAPKTPPVSPLAAGAQRPDPVIVRQTRDEIIAQLHKSKLSEAEIAELMALVDASAPPGSDPSQVAAATAEAVKKALGDGKPGEGAPPGGLEEVLKMMASGKAPGMPGGPGGQGGTGSATPPAPNEPPKPAPNAGGPGPK